MSWKEVDRRLIKIGEILFRCSNLVDFKKEEHKKELREMNKRKRGRPFKFSGTIIAFAAAMHTLLPLRQLSGMFKSLLSDNPHYTTLHKRIRKESFKWKHKKIRHGILFYREDLSKGDYFIDSTGFSLRRKGEWFRIKLKLRKIRSWYKFHKICDKRGEIVAFAITSQNVNDSSLFEELACKLPKGSALHGDKAYFSRKNYKIAKKLGIEFHSPPKRNALQKWRSIKEFADEVKLFNELGYEKWAEKTGYKKRFNMEFVFSRLKLIFGESIRAYTLTGAAFTLLNMVELCNLSLRA